MKRIIALLIMGMMVLGSVQFVFADDVTQDGESIEVTETATDESALSPTEENETLGDNATTEISDAPGDVTQDEGGSWIDASRKDQNEPTFNESLEREARTVETPDDFDLSSIEAPKKEISDTFGDYDGTSASIKEIKAEAKMTSDTLKSEDNQVGSESSSSSDNSVSNSNEDSGNSAPSNDLANTSSSVAAKAPQPVASDGQAVASPQTGDNVTLMPIMALMASIMGITYITKKIREN